MPLFLFPPGHPRGDLGTPEENPGDPRGDPEATPRRPGANWLPTFITAASIRPRLPWTVLGSRSCGGALGGSLGGDTLVGDPQGDHLWGSLGESPGGEAKDLLRESPEGCREGFLWDHMLERHHTRCIH